MLPITGSAPEREVGQGSFSLSRYLKRVLHSHNQLDLQYAYFVMTNLLFHPKKVFQHTKLRKQTKNQWARDDPVMIILQIVFIVVSTLAYAVAMGALRRFPLTVFWCIFVDYFLFGGIVATISWFFANTYLR